MSLSSMFKVSKEDVDNAKKSGFVEFKTGDTPVFLIEEIKEETEKDKERIIIGCSIIGGEHDGRKYSHFIYASNKKFFVQVLGCFFTEEEIMSEFNIEDIIGQQFTGTVKLNDYKGKTYTNFNSLTAVSNVPEGMDEEAQPEERDTSEPHADDADCF